MVENEKFIMQIIIIKYDNNIIDSNNIISLILYVFDNKSNTSSNITKCCGKKGSIDFIRL